MRKLAAIVACCEGGGIGYKGAMPWGRIRKDLARFRKLTMGHTVLMGRKTFESIGCKPLDGRRNIVITRSPELYPAPEHDGNLIATSNPEQAVLLATGAPDDMGFVIGGAEIYALLLPFTSVIYMTRIGMKCTADKFFPEIDPKEWREAHKEKAVDEELTLEFVDWIRAGTLDEGE